MKIFKTLVERFKAKCEGPDRKVEISVDELLAMRSEVEDLAEALRPFANAWLAKAPRHDGNETAYQRRLERALEGFYSSGQGDESARLTGQHLKDAYDLLSAKNLLIPRRGGKMIGDLAWQLSIDDREGRE
ncbi:hypothetical protein [Parasedimentitalea maritima]|uniref:Uncharacterized protein n=1 Tax=Parasedimentitalea maritima TaxID=2578117 RepID=A0A6A4RCJ3_9RHOB|nr:hypothetical protein [Zongyanglinia marina]KAE9624475.1 hypothetical protein GP644_23425 [Zongyanglinia marina]